MSTIADFERVEFMEDKTKYYDLTLSQNLMLVAVKYSWKKAIVNIGTSMWFDEEIDRDILEETIYTTIDRIDSLRIRLKKINKEFKQYFTEEQAKKIKQLDFSDMSFEEIGNKFELWTRTPMKYDDSDMYEFIIIKAPENKTILYIKVNHIVMDAWGLTVLAKDLIEVYCALRDKKELPDMPTQFMPIIEKELIYNDSERFRKDFEYWKEYYKSKPNYASISRKDIGKPYRKVSIFRCKSNRRIYTLAKKKTDIIKKFCLENNVSLQILLLIGIRCYLAILNKKEEIGVINVVARRSSSDTKKAGGMMINILPFMMNCLDNTTFIEACREISSNLFTFFRHSDFPYENVMTYIKKTHFQGNMLANFIDVTLTFQAGKINTKEDLNFHLKYHSNDANGTGIYLTVMDISNLGTLDFVFDYNVAFVSKKMVSQFYYQILKTIEFGINSPNITLKEIMSTIEKIQE